MPIYIHTFYLASKEIAEVRQKISDEEYDARRTDLIELKRPDMQLSNGLDPENTWDYDADNGSDDDKPEEGD